MCGRICVASTQEEIARLFGMGGQLPGLHAMPPRYNIAPTQPVLTILDGPAGREARLMKWAFLPSWVSDPRKFSLLNNARAETIEEKPSFRTAIRHRRCLLPVSGFYEWHQGKGALAKQPYWIWPSTTSLMALAGIWESWMGPNGEEVDTMAVVTTKANKTMAPVHHRMPVIIDAAQFAIWLDCRSGRVNEARPLMRPISDDALLVSPVSNRVNAVANDDKSLIEPIDLAPVEKAHEQPADQGQLTLF